MLSTLACSFPSHHELAKKDGSRLDNHAPFARLALPALLLGAAGVQEEQDHADQAQQGVALLPARLDHQGVARLGAALEQDAGQWFMGLQWLRESPIKGLEKAAERWWGVWRDSHTRYLRRSTRSLRGMRRRQPESLLSNPNPNPHSNPRHSTFTLTLTLTLTRRAYCTSGSASTTTATTYNITSSTHSPRRCVT